MHMTDWLDHASYVNCALHAQASCSVLDSRRLAALVYGNRADNRTGPKPELAEAVSAPKVTPHLAGHAGGRSAAHGEPASRQAPGCLQGSRERAPAGCAWLQRHAGGTKPGTALPLTTCWGCWQALLHTATCRIPPDAHSGAAEWLQ